MKKTLFILSLFFSTISIYAQYVPDTGGTFTGDVFFPSLTTNKYIYLKGTISDGYGNSGLLRGYGINNDEKFQLGAASTTLSQFYLFNNVDFRFYGQTAGEIMRLTKDGKVGIGTYNPAEILQVNSSNNPTIAIGSPNFNTGGKSSLKFSAGDGTNYNGFEIQYNRSGSNDYLALIDGTLNERLVVRNGGKVGIGTNNPGYELDVVGTINASNVLVNGQSLATNWLSTGNSINYQSGSVGIGTAAPATLLHVDGAGTSLGLLKYQQKIQGTGTHAGLMMAHGGNGGVMGYANLGSGAQANVFYVTTGHVTIGDRSLVMDNDGFVGIGTSTPTQKLSVNGNVLAKEVTVSTEASDWPDYVFGIDYKLRDLRDLESFIKTNGHLPNVPSATEIESTGQHLGMVQKKLLEKIEEMTLYIIATDKENQSLKKSNAELKSTLESLLNRVEQLEKQAFKK